MSPQEIIEAVESVGGHIKANGDRLKIEAPKGKLGPELVATLKERKPDVLEYLRLAESCQRIEEKRIAIKVSEKDGEKGWWLVASTAQSEVDDDAPVYLATEWFGIITSGLSHEEIRTLDTNIKTFGIVERIDLHRQCQGDFST